MPGYKKLVLCLALHLASFSCTHAIDRAHYRELFQKLGVAAKQKDWQAARDVLTEIGRELPAPTPRYLLTVASIEAKLGHKVESLRWLEKFAATGLNFDLATDEELKGLLADPAGQKIAAQMKERSLPKTGTELVCALPQADTMPEDIAYLKSAVRNQKAVITFPAFSTARSIGCHCPKLGARNAPCRNCLWRTKPGAGPRWPSLPILKETLCG
ncbi:MAG: hypothetical protein ACXVK3_07115 [Candidatus Angelobacter sp.]